VSAAGFVLLEQAATTRAQLHRRATIALWPAPRMSSLGSQASLCSAAPGAR